MEDASFGDIAEAWIVGVGSGGHAVNGSLEACLVPVASLPSQAR